MASLPSGQASLLLSAFHDCTVTSAEIHAPLALKSLHLASGKDWRANPKLSAKLGVKVPLRFQQKAGGREGREADFLTVLPSLCIYMISSRKHLNNIDGTKCLARW